MDEAGRPVIGVIGGSGGVGSSSFAAVLALVAAPSVLVDVDAAAGGADVVLGLEREAGARWSGLRVAGGHLDAPELIAALPQRAGCAVLAADTTELDPNAVTQVLTAARSCRPVIVDLPRAALPVRDVALLGCDLVVLIARADVTGLVAAHAMAGGLGPDVVAGVIVRRGDVTPPHAARLVGLPLLGVLPPARSGRFELDPRRLPRPTGKVARGVLAGVRT